MIKIISPILLADGCRQFRIEGWCTASRSGDVQITFMDGRRLNAQVSEAQIRPAVFPGRECVLFSCPVDLSELVPEPLPQWASHGVSIAFDITAGSESGRAEYQVSDAWIKHHFGSGCDMRPKLFPPYHLQARIAGESGVAFASFGELAVRQMVDLLACHGQDMSAVATVLDFGCGPGRVIRHFKAAYPHMRLCGADIDPEAIEWCAGNLNDVGEFYVNDILPPLPYPDETFDFIYTVSTFTHMPESMQFAWLLELRRILKRGGHLLATVHGPAMVDYIITLYPGASALRDELHAGGFVYVGEEREGWPTYFGKTTCGLPSFYKLSYHSHSYIREHWSDYFDILSIGSMNLNIFQDAVLARKGLLRGAIDDERFLQSSLFEKAAREALNDSFRANSKSSAQILELSSQIAALEEALREAQHLAITRLDEIHALAQRFADADRALGEAQHMAIGRLHEIEALTKRIAATDQALAEAQDVAIARLKENEALTRRLAETKRAPGPSQDTVARAEESKK